MSKDGRFVGAEVEKLRALLSQEAAASEAQPHVEGTPVRSKAKGGRVSGPVPYLIGEDGGCDYLTPQGWRLPGHPDYMRQRAHIVLSMSEETQRIVFEGWARRRRHRA